MHIKEKKFGLILPMQTHQLSHFPIESSFFGGRSIFERKSHNSVPLFCLKRSSSSDSSFFPQTIGKSKPVSGRIRSKSPEAGNRSDAPGEEHIVTAVSKIIECIAVKRICSISARFLLLCRNFISGNSFVAVQAVGRQSQPRAEDLDGSFLEILEPRFCPD